MPSEARARLGYSHVVECDPNRGRSRTESKSTAQASGEVGPRDARSPLREQCEAPRLELIAVLLRTALCARYTNRRFGTELRRLAGFAEAGGAQ